MTEKTKKSINVTLKDEAIDSYVYPQTKTSLLLHEDGSAANWHDIEINPAEEATRTFDKLKVDHTVYSTGLEEKEIEVISDKEVDITGYTDMSDNSDLPDETLVTIDKIEGQTRRASLNLFKPEYLEKYSEIHCIGKITQEDNQSILTINPSGKDPSYYGQIIYLPLGEYSIKYSKDKAFNTPSYWYIEDVPVGFTANEVLNITLKTTGKIHIRFDAEDSGTKGEERFFNIQIIPGKYNQSTMPKYTSYNNQLINAHASKIISTGSNLFNIYNTNIYKWRYESWDHNYVTPSDISYKIVNNKLFIETKGGQFHYVGFYIPLRAGSYSLALKKPTSRSAIAVLDKDLNQIIAKNEDTSNGATLHFTIHDDHNYYIGFANFSTSQFLEDIQLNYSSTTLPYEEYKENNYTINEELGQWDYIDFQKSVIVRQTSRPIRLTGNESWQLHGSDGFLLHFYNINRPAAVDDYDHINIVSTHMNTLSQRSQDKNTDIAKYSIVANKVLIVRNADPAIAGDLQAFKNWLKTTQIEISYKLSSPTIVKYNLMNNYLIYKQGMQIQDIFHPIQFSLPYKIFKKYNLSKGSQLNSIIDATGHHQELLNNIYPNQEYTSIMKECALITDEEEKIIIPDNTLTKVIRMKGHTIRASNNLINDSFPVRNVGGNWSYTIPVWANTEYTLTINETITTLGTNHRRQHWYKQFDKDGHILEQSNISIIDFTEKGQTKSATSTFTTLPGCVKIMLDLGGYAQNVGLTTINYAMFSEGKKTEFQPYNENLVDSNIDEIRSTGKNLLNMTELCLGRNKKGIQTSLVDDYTIQPGTDVVSDSRAWGIANSEYSLSLTKGRYNLKIYFEYPRSEIDNDPNQIRIFSDNGIQIYETPYYNTSNNREDIIEIPKTGKYYIMSKIWRGKCSCMLTRTVQTIPFEPYHENIYPIHQELGEFDEIDVIGQKIIRKTGHIEFHGGSDEDWYAEGDYYKYKFHKNLPLVNKYTHISNLIYFTGWGQVGDYPEHYWYGYMPENYIIIHSSGMNTESEFRQWLHDHPVQVAYESKDVTIEPLILPYGYITYKDGTQQQILNNHSAPLTIRRDYILSLGSQVAANTMAITTKQDRLIAGNNITIDNNTINSHGMIPSNTFSDYIPYSSGMTYTAPADGYLHYKIYFKPQEQIQVLIAQSNVRDYILNHNNFYREEEIHGIIPIAKGESLYFSEQGKWQLDPSNYEIRFNYAK